MSHAEMIDAAAFVRQRSIHIPVVGRHAPAGTPAPADDFIEKTVDLNEHLIRADYSDAASRSNWIRFPVEAPFALSNSVLSSILHSSEADKRFLLRNPERPDTQLLRKPDPHGALIFDHPIALLRVLSTARKK